MRRQEIYNRSRNLIIVIRTELIDYFYVKFDLTLRSDIELALGSISKIDPPS